MAVFLVNECKFLGCGLEFQSLRDLIHHIEDTHIDTDPLHLEHQELEQPQALAPSYILRFFTDADPKYKVRPVSPSSSLRSSTPIGSEFDEDDLPTDGYESDDSTSANQELTAPLILSMLTRNPGECDKPIVCPIPGCKKRYKNINGMKYHARNGHKKDLSFVQKAYKCECGKSYKTLHGLKNHSSNVHSSDILSMTSMTLTKTKDMLLATQNFAPKQTIVRKEPAIKHVSMAPNNLKQTSTPCQFTNVLKLDKNANHEKLKSPVLSMNTMMSLSPDDMHIDIMETSFLDEESQSFITSEQARFQ